MEIVEVWGPWLSSGDWWDKVGNWQREEWDVQIRINGELGLYRIFREFGSDLWFVEGMYD